VGKILEQVLIDDFKKMGIRTLKSLRVALLNPVTIIYNDKEKEAILYCMYISQRSSTRRSHWHN